MNSNKEKPSRKASGWTATQIMQIAVFITAINVALVVLQIVWLR